MKPKPRFPKEWALTEERKQELAQIQTESLRRDSVREITGSVMDGIKQIQEGIARASLVKERIPEMASKGKKKVAVKRG